MVIINQVIFSGHQLNINPLIRVLRGLNKAVRYNNLDTKAYVIGHRLLWRVELFMIRATTRLVNESTRDPLHQQTVINTELDHRVQLPLPVLQQLIQLRTTKYVQLYTYTSSYTGCTKNKIPFPAITKANNEAYLFCLHNCSREAVQQKSVSTRVSS